MKEINQPETSLKVNSSAYCKTNVIPKRREDVVVRQRSSTHVFTSSSKIVCSLLLNKCNFYAKRSLPLVGVVGRLLLWRYVFPESSKLPLDRQKVFQLARHLRTNTTCLICVRRYDFVMNID